MLVQEIGNATPKQVIRALAADWRQRGLSYHDVASMTRYKYLFNAQGLTIIRFPF